MSAKRDQGCTARRLALNVAALGLMASLASSTAWAANDVDQTVKGVIKITVNIEFSGAVTQSLIDKWEGWVVKKAFWGRDFTYYCNQVIIVPNFKLAGEGD